jgi:cytochrome P450
VASDEISGYRIRANSQVWLSPYVTHHHPDFWDRPEVFDPEQFMPERSAGCPRYAYFPFGGGPHQCIGNTLKKVRLNAVQPLTFPCNE